MLKYFRTGRMFIFQKILKVYFSMLSFPRKRLEDPWVWCLRQAGLMLNQLSNTTSTLKLQTVDRREVSLVGQLHGHFVSRNCDLPTPRCSSCRNTSIVWSQSPVNEVVWAPHSNCNSLFNKITKTRVTWSCMLPLEVIFRTVRFIVVVCFGFMLFFLTQFKLQSHCCLL